MEVKECGENGYPHVHLVYPGLKYLADQELIKKLWGHGHIKVNYGGSFKPASYACKYISKMGKNDLGLMFMWWDRIKLYTFSRAFEYHRYRWTEEIRPRMLSKAGRRIGPIDSIR